MNAAPPDDRIKAQAQLEQVALRLYAEPVAALDAMRHAVQMEGAEAVRRRLEHDFTHYGAAAAPVQGPARERAQQVLSDGGLAADMERWLTLDHAPSGPQLTQADEVERVMRAPEPEAPAPLAAEARRMPPG
ncbi:MAG TPA: hypothetical protein VFR81_18190, partial [Longimicrobium sp.]|nr:hypothetical protein [Longimicrobium sp.]